MYEKSLIIIKPDGIQRSIAGSILSRFENAGLKVHAMKLQNVTAEQSKRHYSEHVEKAFYPTVEEYITSGPVIVFVLGGLSAIKKIRTMVGATEPSSALPGTIRGDFAHQAYPGAGEPDDKPIRNLIHASATADEAAVEIALWFNEDEIVDYSKVSDEQLSF
jgi:nucleoside-diphosphate kinase